MPHAAPPAAPSPSPLASALLRLEDSLRGAREADRRSERLFQTWQARWESQRNRMAERLRAIDGRLCEFEGRCEGRGEERSVAPPHLALYGVPSDGPAMSSMGN